MWNARFGQIKLLLMLRRFDREVNILHLKNEQLLRTCFSPATSYGIKQTFLAFAFILGPRKLKYKALLVHFMSTARCRHTKVFKSLHVPQKMYAYLLTMYTRVSGLWRTCRITAWTQQ